MFSQRKVGNVFDVKGSRKYLNVRERQAFYKAACEINDNSERTFCLLLYYSGCRISEALSLSAANVDKEENQIVFKTLKQKKGVKYRAVPVPTYFLSSFHAKKSERLWAFSRVTGWRIIKRCMKAAGIEGTKATPKGLRHGFAVACISQNIPITVVQRWLGHTNLKNTAIYLEVSGAEDRKFAKRTWGK